MKLSDPSVLRNPIGLLCLMVCSGYAASGMASPSQRDAAAIAVGPVDVTPTLGVEAKYRDNIYLQEDNETSSWIYLLQPGINARVQDRLNYYQLDYKSEAAWYEEDSDGDENNYYDQTFSGDAHMLFSDTWVVDLGASWAGLHEDRGTGLSEGVVGRVLPKPIKYDQTDFTGSVRYGREGGIGALKLRAGYMDRVYQNFRDLTRLRDRDETTLGATLYYPLAPKTDLLLEYTYKDINYPNNVPELAPLDSEENFVLLGVEWEITPNLVSVVKAGYVDKSFASSEREDWDGVGIELALQMQPTEIDRVRINGRRSPEETSVQGDFIVREELSAEWVHDWSDRVYTTLDGSAGRDTFEGSFDDREDDIYSIGIEAGYAFRRWANFYIGYVYDEKDSNVDTLSYTDNTFRIGVDLSL
ncbi:MAG: outer membrane beta-barrel protein [Pseudomonadota bacterium]